MRTRMSFVFTDIEGSTVRWEMHPNSMMTAVARHDALIDASMTRYGGTVFHRSGDGFIAWFESPVDAAVAAAHAQREITAADWDLVGGLGVRMAVHVGDVVLRNDEPFGWALNLGSRLNSIGHGGQVLVSEAAAQAVGTELADDLDLIALGPARLRDIARPTQVFQLRGHGLGDTFPPLRNTVASANLPVTRTSIVGRDDEIDVVVRALERNRIVTLVGLRGVGTSRLAIAAASRVAPSFSGGTLHADLAGVSPTGVSGVLATSFGIGLRSGRSVDESMIEWLGNQKMLLVIEHCERSIEAVDRLLNAVLAGAPNTTMLCTSERPLGIDGEMLHRVSPLSLDASVQLFADRAAAVGADISDSADVRELCAHLDGMPLAIEVAAANAAIHTAREQLDTLRRMELSERVESSEDLRSMYDAVSMSFSAIPAELQDVLSAASTFAGPFDRDAFAAVCLPGSKPAEVDAALTELLNRSLIQLGHSNGRPLFHLLSIVSECARRQAPAAASVAAGERFLDYMIAACSSAAAGLRGPDELLHSRRVGEQFGNIRAAFERSLAAGDITRAATISTVLWDYGFMRMNAEYFRWSERVIDTFAAGDEARLAPVLGVAAFGAWFRDDIHVAFERAQRAIRLERDFDLEFDLPARLALINATVYSGAGQAPADIFAEQAAYQRRRPELYFHVNVDAQNSIMATWLGDPEAATRRALRAVRVARESRNPSTLAFALWALGSALATEDEPQAETLLGNALEIAREVDNGWLTALVQMSLASLRRRSGSAMDSVPLLLDLLDLLSRAGHRSHLWATLRLSGLVLGDLGDDALAVQLLSWVHGVQLAMPPLPADAVALAAQAERLSGEHGDEWVRRTAALATSWTTESAVAQVRAALEEHLASVASAPTG